MRSSEIRLGYLKDLINSLRRANKLSDVYNGGDRERFELIEDFAEESYGLSKTKFRVPGIIIKRRYCNLAIEKFNSIIINKYRTQDKTITLSGLGKWSASTDGDWDKIINGFEKLQKFLEAEAEEKQAAAQAAAAKQEVEEKSGEGLFSDSGSSGDDSDSSGDDDDVIGSSSSSKDSSRPGSKSGVACYKRTGFFGFIIFLGIVFLFGGIIASIAPTVFATGFHDLFVGSPLSEAGLQAWHAGFIVVAILGVAAIIGGSWGIQANSRIKGQDLRLARPAKVEILAGGQRRPSFPSRGGGENTPIPPQKSASDVASREGLG